MRRKIALGIVILLVAMFTLTFSIPGIKAQKTSVVVGWAHPLTGPVAATAQTHHLYYRMVCYDYNQKGGLNVPGIGLLPIEIIEYDDEYDPAKSLSFLTKLMTEDNVDLVFAPWSTSFCVAALPLFEQYGYPTVGLTVGSNTISDLLSTGEYEYFFLTLGQPREDAEDLVELIQYINAEIAAPGEGIDTAGFAYRADEHGIEHAEAIRDALEDMGIAVPVYQSYAPFPPPADWTPTITAFRDAEVDVAILCAYDEGAAYVRQCIDQDYSPKLMIIGPALETPFLVYDVFGFTYGEFAGLAYYNGFPATTFSTPELKAWVQYHMDYTAQFAGFPYRPFPASGVFYAGLECMFIAVEEHGLDRELIRDALETETFDTLVGTLKFRAGLSPLVENHGTLTQWQRGRMMEVIWPLDQASADVIYPKFQWWWAAMPDINSDGRIGIGDVFKLAVAFGTAPGHPRWDPAADVNLDGKVGIQDVFLIAQNFGETYAPK